MKERTGGRYSILFVGYASQVSNDQEIFWDNLTEKILYKVESVMRKVLIFAIVLFSLFVSGSVEAAIGTEDGRTLMYRGEEWIATGHGFNFNSYSENRYLLSYAFTSKAEGVYADILHHVSYPCHIPYGAIGSFASIRFRVPEGAPLGRYHFVVKATLSTNENVTPLKQNITALNVYHRFMVG